VITEDAVMRLLEQADPARQQDPASAAEPTEYFETLRARSDVPLIETALPRHQRPDWRRLMTLAAAAAAILLVGALVLTTRGDPVRQVTEQPPMSMARLAGVWSLAGSRDADGEVQADARGVLMTFGADGDFAFDSRGSIDVSPTLSGTYELDTSTVVTHRLRGVCSEAIDFTVAMPEDGRLHTTVTESGEGKGCAIPVGTTSEWVRVSPISAAGSATVTTVQSVEDTAPPTLQAMYGIWQLQGSGQLLRLAIDGTYAVDDGGQLAGDPDDTGRYEIDGHTLTLTSAGSASCAAGDTQVLDGFTLRSVRVAEADLLLTKVIDATASGSACPIHTAGDQTWLRISP
jgi:hypothetical protein